MHIDNAAMIAILFTDSVLAANIRLSAELFATVLFFMLFLRACRSSKPTKQAGDPATTDEKEEVQIQKDLSNDQDENNNNKIQSSLKAIRSAVWPNIYFLVFDGFQRNHRKEDKILYLYRFI